MHASLISLALLSTSALALQGTLTNPRSYGMMLPRGNAITKRQGYYPTSTLCDGDGNTCAEVCGSDTTECPSGDTLFLHCHSTTDGSHCCKDGTGNSCGPGDYCTNDGAGQTYCCPENLNAADCAAAFGIDVTLIPDTETPSTVDVPSPSATDDSTPVETPAGEDEDEEDMSSSEAVTPTSKTTSPSETSRATVVPTSAARSSVAAPSRTPNATTPTTVGPSPTQFTGGAAKVAGAGAALVVAVAGLAVL